MRYDDLAKFCNTDGVRSAIAAPFYRHGKYIATDAIILVALDEKPDGWMDRPEAGCECENLWAWIKTPPRPAWEHPIPESMFPPPRKCWECNGEGRLKVCPECDGTCIVECFHCGHDAQCQKCDGIGTVPGRDGDDECESCRGSGTLRKRLFVEAYGAAFDNEQLTRIHHGLPPIQTVQESDGINPARLNFAGGFCLIMPMLGAQALPALTAEQYDAATKETP